MLPLPPKGVSQNKEPTLLQRLLHNRSRTLRGFGCLCFALCLATVVAWPQTQHSITIAWSASPTAGVKYDVYRNTAATGTFTQIKTDVAGLSYSDTTGTPGTTYFYEVSSVCDTTTTCAAGLTGESALSSASNGATFLGTPSVPPGAPVATAQ